MIFTVVIYDTFLMVKRTINVKADSTDDVKLQVNKLYPHYKVLEVVNEK